MEQESIFRQLAMTAHLNLGIPFPQLILSMVTLPGKVWLMANMFLLELLEIRFVKTSSPVFANPCQASSGSQHCLHKKDSWSSCGDNGKSNTRGRYQKWDHLHCCPSILSAELNLGEEESSRVTWPKGKSWSDSPTHPKVRWRTWLVPKYTKSHLASLTSCSLVRADL